MPAATQPPHLVKIFDMDPNRPLVAGRNPAQIATTEIPYQQRIPRRSAAAAEAVQAITGRRPSISHATNGSIVATVYVPSTNVPASPPVESGGGGGGGGGDPTHGGAGGGGGGGGR